MYCRDACAKYINGNQVVVKGVLRFPDGNSPEDLSLFSSLMLFLIMMELSEHTQLILATVRYMVICKWPPDTYIRKQIHPANPSHPAKPLIVIASKIT